MLVLAQGMLPAWLVLPICGLVMVVLAVHVVDLQRTAAIPSTRRKLRTACGMLMLFTSALLAYALCVQPEPSGSGVSGSDGRAFVLVWTAIVALLAVIVTLAAFDAVHTLILARNERRRLLAEMKFGDARPLGGRRG